MEATFLLAFTGHLSHRGRRGMLCRIINGGIIRQGDGIEKLA
jgi:MOSC domain-containing protein YiiM